MKFTVESNKDGIDIELQYSTAKKPVKQSLTREQVEGLIRILEAAVKADTFRFTLALD